MKIINLIRIALRAMQRNRLRTFLTMLGIIIGVASVIAMLAIGQGSKQSIEAQISGMGTNMIMIRPNSDMEGGVRQESSNMQTLTVGDVKAISSECTQVASVSAMVSGRGQVIYSSKNWPTQIQGVNPSFLEIRKMDIKDGVMFTDKDVTQAAKVCVLGKTVIDNLFPNGESPIGKSIRFKSIPLKVVGVLTPKGENTFGQDQDDIILAPFTTVQKRLLAITYVQNIYASAVSEEASDAAVKEISEVLRRDHKLKDSQDDDFSVRTQAELISTFSSTSQMLTVLLAAIAGISLFVGGIGIMNIMFVSVTERTREIGLRMAVGGRSVDIMMQFLMEAIMISMAGGIIGVVLGVTTSYTLSSGLGWPVLVTNYSIIISFLVCAVTGVFFGWYPAKKASNLDPIEALRYE